MNAHWIHRTTPRLIPCSDCRILTVHHQTASGEYVCWCGNVDTLPERVAWEIRSDEEWLGETEADHADWKDEKRTQEEARF